MQKNKYIGKEEFVKRIKSGIDIVHEAVVGTIGASGRNVMYRDYTGNPVVTNDGYTIAEMIQLEDEAQAMGVDFIKQASRRQNYEAGDGTTTVIALTHAMIEKGLEKVKEGSNPMRIKREMKQSLLRIAEKLKKSSQKITTDKGLFDVANISMENPDMARIVVDSVKAGGEYGRVVVEESTGVETKTEEVKGIEFPKGRMSSYMVNTPNDSVSYLEDVHVLIADKSFGLLKDLFPVLEGLKSKGHDKLLIICPDVVGEAMGNLLVNIEKKSFFTVAVYAPEDKNVLEDIAILTGSTIIREVNSPNGLSPAHVNWLGKAKRVIVTNDRTIIDSGNGDKKQIESRINSLKAEIKDSDDHKKDMLKDRLAKLAGKVIYIKVGAPTQQEMKYLKLKVDDAVASTIAAKNGGIVVGGGRALYDISLEKPKSEGEEIVLYGCSFPMRKIIENARVPSVDDVLKTLDKGQAWNSLTEQPVKDYIKEGIIDPVDIEIWALKNAISTASMFLTTHASLIDIPKKLSPVVQ